jgi:mono/diheme cytochrome c family protein
MKAAGYPRSRTFLTGGFFTFVVAGFAYALTASNGLKASPPWFGWGHHKCYDDNYGPAIDEFEGTWYWLRSPEQEKRVISSYFNRYCIRCHGVDGRGVWDIPDVPDFTNDRWQASRTDGQLARLILEGRGAVMPPFRGTLTLEEAWAMGRYLRSFVPGSESSRPDLKPSSSNTVPPRKLPD